MKLRTKKRLCFVVGNIAVTILLLMEFVENYSIQTSVPKSALYLFCFLACWNFPIWFLFRQAEKNLAAKENAERPLIQNGESSAPSHRFAK